MSKKAKIVLCSAVAAGVLGVSTEAFAESLYSMGWSNTYWIDNFTDGSSRYAGHDVADMTVSAFSSGNNGTVRVRSFAHTDQVYNYYYNNVADRTGSWLTGVNKVALTTSDNTSYHDTLFNVNNTDPGPSSTSSGSPIWLGVVYDVMGLVGVPNNTVQAYVNYLGSNGPGVTVDISRNFTRTVTQSAGVGKVFPSSKTELGITDPSSNPDYLAAGSQKGMESLFNYVLNSTTYNYPMLAKGTITYLMRRSSTLGYVTDWYPTASTSLTYNVNRR